ncbi:MAG: hypothetical protein HWN66_21675 [Candidatus Helarchaeota archaeon]|nr:hypothetical protein [Candidatus Helarchaeota archaeon]
MKLYRVFTISGIVYVSIGLILEIIYWTVLKNIYWILLVYPPPHIQNLIMMAPYIGGLLILIGGASLITGIWFYLKADLEILQKL